MNGAPAVGPMQTGDTIQLIDRNTQTSTDIKPISSYATYKSLGTYQGVSAHSSAQFRALKKKTIPLIRALVNSPVTQHQAYLHHSLCFHSSIVYPLSVCHLSQNQLHKLQSSYLSISRNKLGLPRSHPDALLFGPRRYGGLGILNLQIEAALSGVETIVRNLRTTGTADNIITLFLHKWQQASGMSHPLLQYPSIHAPHLEGHYYTHIRSFLATHQLSLEIHGIDILTPPRENDECIMDVACDSDVFTDKEIRKIFYCKNYLEVKWLSDMCTADGEQLLAGPFEGICSF